MRHWGAGIVLRAIASRRYINPAWFDVELRYFAGLSYEETAEALNVSVGTARRDWSFAQAWLFRELNKGRINDA
jgi:ECF sigma factor